MRGCEGDGNRPPRRLEEFCHATERRGGILPVLLGDFLGLGKGTSPQAKAQGDVFPEDTTVVVHGCLRTRRR